jgi:hypothetical protein
MKALGLRYAIWLLVCLAPLTAHATKFSLADANGVPSCHYISFHRKLNILYGYWQEHRQCGSRSDYAEGSGVALANAGSPTPVWSMSLTDTTIPHGFFCSTSRL